MVFSIVASILKLLGGGNVAKLIDGVTAVAKNKTDAQTIDNQTGAKLGMEYLTAVNETNRIKASTQTERTVLFGLFMFAFPAGIVWWAALLDGIPFYGHVVGSWKIAVPPGFIESFNNIVNSFFIAAPAVAGASILARTFGRR
jgi:hypothetical protein